ncbi:MAG: type II toxin-antitoxin system PrlF family antitoxin [Chloroflexi bacterium]|nr:type II toxin-antitoxin system PrlF family antitoxin [Chloroflexota bacterium]
MKEILSTISSKGQVTVPVEVRRYLGLGKNDKIAFVIQDEGTVEIKAPRYRTVRSLRGAAGSLKEPLTWEETRAIAREDALAEAAEHD